MANFWGHPPGSPAPTIDQHIWAIDTDRDIKIDYKQLVFKGNYVLGLDVEVGNMASMQTRDAINQLVTEIRTLVAKYPEFESKI